MRKLILSAFFMAAGTVLFAQNLNDIQEKISKGKYDEAKEKVDKVLTEPKFQKNANAWYYKGVVYNELAKDTTKKDMDYRMEAFNAFKKYQELDPKNVLMTLEQNGRLFQIYEGYYNQGIAAFNTKNYDKAFSDFKNALTVKDYVYEKKYEINGFSFPAIDTQLVNLAGSAGMLAKQEDAAIPYFAILADAKLKGDDFKDIYPILVDYYGRKNDATNKAKYLAIGQELYPENPYWLASQLEAAGDDKGKRLDMYKELVAKNPNNSDLATDYGVELFNYIYGKDKPANYDERKAELTAALQAAINANPQSAQANFVMTQHISNDIYDMQLDYQAIKGTKPEDVKKKQELNKKIDARYEDLFKFANTAVQQYEKMTDLKAVDKANYRSVLNQMVDYYTMKKQADKAKVYNDKVKNLK
ncbi:MAG TPA: hypothetical protein VGE66_08590 [Chitinophagaceae bacterium]